MAVPTQITDHAAQARARLPEQFRDATNLKALLDAVSAQIQALEDSGVDLLEPFDIDAAADDQLDTIGAVVNEPRNGASDADYRVAIRGKIALIFGSGTPDDIIAAYILLTAATTVNIIEVFPAHFDLLGDGTEPSNLAEMIDAVAAAGVGVGIAANLVYENGDNAITESSENLYVVPTGS